jgi:uncharacterized repeat protein (TIGR02059 family)
MAKAPKINDWTGTAVANNVSLAQWGEPGSGDVYNLNGLDGIDSLILNNNGKAAYNTPYQSAGFTIAPVNASGVIVVSGASSGGTQLTFNLTSIETLVFADQTVTLNYGAPPPAGDTTAPVFSSAAVNGSTLVMNYNEALSASAPAASSFAVTGHTVTGVAVSGQTVTLTLGTPVTNGEVVKVSYTDPTTGNDANAVQDAAGNDAVSVVSAAVTNNTPVPPPPPPPAGDTTAPVFSSAAVNGSTLVMTYNEALSASAPAASSFAVPGHTVTGVAVSGQTVTLTLGTPVTNGESVTVSYTDPTAGNDANAIQDAVGNDAVSLGATSVTNNTPAPPPPAGDTTAPVFSSAAVNGSTLVMNYNEALSASAPAASSFVVPGHTVTGVAVSGQTVTLTLGTPVTNGELVKVSYTDPTTGNDANAVQDTAGNDAATLGSTAVTNNTPVPPPPPPPAGDTTAPVFGSATVNGSTLVMNYNEALSASAPAASSFAVPGHTVTGVAVSGQTVTLTLGTPVTNGEVVKISYTDPTAGNDTNAIQDATGNDAASLVSAAVTNNTAAPVPGDTAAPVFASAAVNGSTLVMSYTDINNLDAANLPSTGAFKVSGHTVSGVVVDPAAHTVTLSLATPVINGEVVTVGYTDPTTGNDVNAIQDSAGNDAASLTARTVTNNTPAPAPADTAAPVFGSAAVNGSTLVMNYTDANNLDAAHLPSNSAFTVSGHTVSGVAVDAAAHTVTLSLATPVTNGEVVSVAYTDLTSGNDINAIQDIAGNDAASLTARTVTNNTPASGGNPPPIDTTLPTVTKFTPEDGATGIDHASNIYVDFSELIQKGQTGTIEIHSGSANGALVERYYAATSSNLSVSGNRLTIDPTHDLDHSTHYFVTFEHGSIKDIAGNGYAGTSVYDFTTGSGQDSPVADPFAATDSNSGSGSEIVIAGVAGLGLLSWALFF